MSRFDLAIFDLDGTLVDSERLAERVLAKTLSQVLDRPFSTEEIRDRFRGRHYKYVVETWEREYGRKIVDQILPLVEEAYPVALRLELQASPGAVDALVVLDSFNKCIASNGELPDIELSLECTGLTQHFPNIFCASMVSRPKPAPDLFLHAAAKMGSAPERTIVIEDSPLGVAAAVAAGMSVIGYTGHHPETADELAAMGAQIVDHFDQIPGLVLA